MAKRTIKSKGMQPWKGKTHAAIWAQWFDERQETFERLRNAIHATLDSLLQSSDVDCLPVSSRVKKRSSFLEKIQRKKYDDVPKEMSDIVGLRIVTYLTRDADRIVELLNSAFFIHKSMSSDEAGKLGRDRLGYRSQHLICEIGPVRSTLPEYKPYVGVRFEIQVRTVLQHAWAQIYHDRGYKFSAELPEKIDRRLLIVSGILENADREFDNIAGEIDAYSKRAEANTEKGNLDFTIDSISFIAFIRSKLKELYGDRMNPRCLDDSSDTDDIVLELRNFGITKLSELDQLIQSHFVTAEYLEAHGDTVVGLFRDMMILENIDRYFSKVKPQWSFVEESAVEQWIKKWGRTKIEKIIEKYELSVLRDGISDSGDSHRHIVLPSSSEILTKPQ